MALQYSLANDVISYKPSPGQRSTKSTERCGSATFYNEESSAAAVEESSYPFGHRQREHKNHYPTPANCFSTRTGPNYMQLSEVAYRINATKSYYLNVLGRLMLRPLLMTLGGDTGVASEPTPPPPTPDAPSPSCPTACFLGGLFDAGFKACLLFLGVLG